MKTINVLLGASGLLLGAFIAQAQTPTPDRIPGAPNFANEARELYVRNAVLRAQTYHWELDDQAKAAPETRNAEAYRLLKELDLLIARLRSAPPTEFEAVKTMFERTRAALDQSLGRGA